MGSKRIEVMFAASGPPADRAQRIERAWRGPRRHDPVQRCLVPAAARLVPGSRHRRPQGEELSGPARGCRPGGDSQATRWLISFRPAVGLSIATGEQTMKYRYAEMIWHEIKEAAAQDRVAVLPVAIHEDHGPHLPTLHRE